MLDAMAFITGAALSAMLGWTQLRADRSTGQVASGYLLLWVLGFIWTFGNFLRCALDLADVAPDTAGARFAETFAWSCTLLGPVTIGRLLQAGIGTTSPVSRGFLAFTMGVSLLNLGLLVRANQLYGFRLEESGYPMTAFYIGLGITVLALLVYRLNRPRTGAPRPRMTPRWFPLAACLFAIVHTAAILLSMLAPDLSPKVRTASELIGRHWTIPWSVLIAVSLAQSHYADVVLKRSLWLLASVVLATAGGVYVFNVAPGLPMLIAILGTATLMLAAPFLLRALEALVDTVILDRPDYAQAKAALDLAFRRATQSDQLIETALTTLRGTLRVDAQWTEAPAASPPAPLAAVSVKRQDQPPATLAVLASHEARTLMQQELAFLESVGKELQLRLDARGAPSPAAHRGGAEGAAHASRPALPVQHPQHHRRSHRLKSCAGRTHDRAAGRVLPLRAGDAFARSIHPGRGT
ncbi:MAG: hypothetical protein K0Q43_5383 [Ramlibacter sp.]|nr:hypothetical protein [Ramlibacter sp.]